jgi:hypothetical protein
MNLLLLSVTERNSLQFSTPQYGNPQDHITTVTSEVLSFDIEVAADWEQTFLDICGEYIYVGPLGVELVTRV